MGGTMRLGAWTCHLEPGSLANAIYGSPEISERHRHRYEFNPAFVGRLVDAGLVVSGRSLDGKFVEMLELPTAVHPWFLGTQAHPELKSRPLDPHPLFVSFIQAAHAHRVRDELDPLVSQPAALGADQ
jgi:CTP synthase